MNETVPSVKGSIFSSVVDDLKAALEEGRLAPEDLEAHLDAKDRGLMQSVVTAVSWLPIATYGRMLDLLALVEGPKQREAYLRDRGARAAERLLSGTYGSFDVGPGKWGPQAGELMVGIAGVLYNFTRWSFSEVTPDSWEIVAEEAKDLPDAAAHTAQGFLDWYLERTSNGRIHSSLSRPTPDRLVFRLSPKD
jgi:hypothetical protein